MPYATPRPRNSNRHDLDLAALDASEARLKRTFGAGIPTNADCAAAALSGTAGHHAADMNKRSKSAGSSGLYFGRIRLTGKAGRALISDRAINNGSTPGASYP
jgi:hypothetical protein